jgi:hypothetical protein
LWGRERVRGGVRGREGEYAPGRMGGERGSHAMGERGSHAMGERGEELQVIGAVGELWEGGKGHLAGSRSRGVL